MDEMSTNVLVIGRSGVGKSSLLNYIFDREIQKTGSGKPVTEKGLFPFKYKYDQNFTICIYDTWGLEPDKALDWKKLITEEVAKHEKQHVKDWFNTIIYCLSANSDRVEDFEVDIIKELVQMKNQMVIAVTHCDKEDDPRANTIKKIVTSHTGVREDQVIPVSNVEKKLIGKSVHKFGREKVFSAIIRNLWESLKVKVPFNVKNKLDVAFEEEKKGLLGMINSQRLLFQRNKKLISFEQDVNSEFKNFVSREADCINSQFTEAMDYYNKVSIRYAEIGLLNKDTIMNMPGMHFEALKEFETKIESKVQVISDTVGEVLTLLKSEVSKKVLHDFGLALKKYFSSSQTIKDELVDTVQDYLKKAREIMDDQIEEMENQLQEIDVEEIGALMIS